MCSHHRKFCAVEEPNQRAKTDESLSSYSRAAGEGRSRMAETFTAFHCLRQRYYVMPGVCLSVCLSVSSSSKHYWTDLRDILPMKNSLNFGSRRVRIKIKKLFVRIFSALWYGAFSTIWLLSLEKKWSDFYENIILDVSLEKEVPVNIWESSGSGPDWRRFALSECFC